jgi:cytochrome b
MREAPLLDSEYKPISTHGPADIVMIPLVRAGALILVLLLALAYLTGEEFQHTHALLGFGVAAVILAWLGWELIRPHELRSVGFASAISAAKSWLRNRTATQSSAIAMVACALMLLVGALGITALAMLWVIHSVWPPASVDEAHEAIAYLSLGLVVFFIVVVIVVSVGQIDRVARKRSAGGSSARRSGN